MSVREEREASVFARARASSHKQFASARAPYRLFLFLLLSFPPPLSFISSLRAPRIVTGLCRGVLSAARKFVRTTCTLACIARVTPRPFRWNRHASILFAERAISALPYGYRESGAPRATRAPRLKRALESASCGPDQSINRGLFFEIYRLVR